MANPDSDTIAAIATATGRSGIGIIRISGSRAVSIAAAIAGSCPESRYVQHADFTGQDDEIIDQGLVIYF
ncbi:MAG: tRNA uridine-5-carboxymethylaminomethyl(34) synthesis GTPase MnmE, partial [Pseudomonadales bacterium]